MLQRNVHRHIEKWCVIGGKRAQGEPPLTHAFIHAHWFIVCPFYELAIHAQTRGCVVPLTVPCWLLAICLCCEGWWQKMAMPSRGKYADREREKLH